LTTLLHEMKRRSPAMLSSYLEPEKEPAPELGQHTREILMEILDRHSDEIDRLESTGVIQTS